VTINMPDRSIAVVLGTRPEIIKLAPILRLLGSAGAIVHTGQHYDDLLSDVFFQGLSLDQPSVVLGIGGVSRAKQIAMAIDGLDDVFEELDPRVVVAQGDTNTVMAAAIAANSRGIPFVHVEAGLRSYDDRMPEEHNRVVADHLSDLLLAPTAVNVENLAGEGIPGDKVVLTGNTIVQAVEAMLPEAQRRSELLAGYGLVASGYILCTLHRPENVDDPSVLDVILGELGRLGLPVVFPMHPRTKATIDAFGLDSPPNLKTILPIGYAEFLGLSAESAFLVSDSGGVQEEVSVYKRPLIVVRRSTERPEVIGSFAERLEPGPEISALGNRWLDDLESLHEGLRDIPSPYGDGTAAQRAVDSIGDLVGRLPG